MSGTASMGNFSALCTPATATIATTANTSMRKRKQSSTSFFMMDSLRSVPVTFGQLAALQHALQNERTTCDDRRFIFQTARDLIVRSSATTERHDDRFER